MHNACSLGVKVNDRSAASPTGNSAVNNTSYQTKGNTEKTQAKSSHRQMSSQELSQLHQKNIQKTKEKVNTAFAQAPQYST